MGQVRQQNHQEKAEEITPQQSLRSKFKGGNFSLFKIEFKNLNPNSQELLLWQ